MQKPDSELLTARQVARLLSADRQMVYGLVDQGVLPAVRLGRWLRFSPSALREFVERGGVTATERASARRRK